MIGGDYQRTKFGTGTRSFYTSRHGAEHNRFEQTRNFVSQEDLGREGIRG